MYHDDLIHELFTSPIDFRGLEPYDVRCPRCNTKLKVYYAESRLYAVKCCYCDTITLVKADSTLKAAQYVENKLVNTGDR